MLETTHFINVGYGWLCKHCSALDNSTQEDATQQPPPRARFLREGEAEEKEPVLSTPALARWRDAARQTLVCPRCSTEELINKA